MTLDEAKIEIRSIVLKAADGAFNPEERQQINRGIVAMFVHAPSYEHGHIRELKRLINIHDSPRKARSLGYDNVRCQILQQLDKIHGAQGRS